MSENEGNDPGVMPTGFGTRGELARDQEPGTRPLGESFSTSDGLADSTGVGRKDTPDATVDERGIAGGPETGQSITAKP